MRKYINIILGICIAAVLVAAAFGIAGQPMPWLTSVAVILAMAVLIVNAFFDIRAGKDKGFPIFLIVIAALAIVSNVASLAMSWMGM